MTNATYPKNKGRFNAGLILIGIGALLLFRTLDLIYLPWLFTWPMIFIALGVLSIARHGFDNGFGIFMLLFGGFFLVKHQGWLPDDFKQYLIPGGLIALGLFLILTQGFGSKKKWAKIGNNSFGSKNFAEDNSDFINTEATFCGVERKVITKNLQGGHVEVNFGGTVLDMTQADIETVATLKVDVNFGGLEIQVPSHWDVQTSVSSVFAGVEDKRKVNNQDQTQKILKIIGSVTFGGIEIKSY